MGNNASKTNKTNELNINSNKHMISRLGAGLCNVNNTIYMYGGECINKNKSHQYLNDLWFINCM